MINAMIGKTGSGKSFLIKSKLKNVRKNAVVFDVNHEYDLRNSIRVENFIDFKKNFGSEKNIICSFFNHDDYFATLEVLCRSKGYVFAMDELALYADSRTFDKNLRNIVVRHRHIGVLFFATQSPLLIPSIMLMQANNFIFNLNKNDVENLRGKLYLKDSEIEKIPKLKRGEYVLVKQTF